MTNYPLFDEQNPEEFKPLTLAERRKLNDEERQAYDAELEKDRKYRRAVRQVVMQSQRNFEQEKKQAEDHVRRRWITRAENEATMLHRLARRVEQDGFLVKYSHTGGFHDVDWSWATAFKLYKEGQEVGTVRIWDAESNWSWGEPTGYRIHTNRGKGSRPDSWSDEKRVKLVESAAKYINETAVPSKEFEAELRKAKEQASKLRATLFEAVNKIDRLRKGYKRGGSRDGFTEQIINQYEAGEVDSMMRTIRNRIEELNTLRDEAAEHALAYDKFMIEKVQPLEERAKRELPELYS